MKIDIRKLIAIACAALVPLTTAALDPEIPLNRYDRHQWTIDDGLPGNTINAMIETTDGALWIGTNNGLARFNGENFTTIQTAPRTDDDGRRITAIHQGRDGTIWIGVEGGGVGRWIDGEYEPWLPSPKLAHASVTAILADSSGRIWVATKGHGLLVWDKEGARWLTKADGWEHARVTGLIEDQRSHVWAGTDGGGVCRFTDKGPVNCADFAGLDIVDLEIDKAGNILLLSESHLSRVPLDRKIARWPVEVDEESPSTTAALEDRDGCRWVATGYALERSHGDGIDRLTPADGFPESTILEILEDHEGSIWIGTDGAGLFRLSTKSPPTRKAGE